jgi:gas vesicle protein
VLNEIPLPIWVAAFGVLFGAIVTAAVTKVRADRATIEAATAISGGKGPMTTGAARKVVNTNAMLKRAVDALQACNDALEEQLGNVKGELEATKNDLTEALRRIGDLEGAIREMTRVRDSKRQRVSDANRDVQT